MAEEINEGTSEVLEELVTSDEATQYIQDLVRSTIQSQEKYDGCVDLQLPDPSLVLYYRSHADRIIWLEDEIDEDAIGVANSIINWNIDDAKKGIPVNERKPIKIYINSPGGNLNECMAICDTMLMSKTPIYTINMNMAASAAAAIFMCGHKRVAFPSSFFLIHLGSGGTGGTYQQTKAQQKNYDEVVKMFKGIFKDRMKITKEMENHFEDLIDGEWYLYMNDTDAASDHNATKYNLVTDKINSLDFFEE